MRTSADAHLLRLCGRSRRYAAEIAINDARAGTIGRKELDDELADLSGKWFSVVEQLAETPALTMAGLRAKAKVCRQAISSVEDDFVPELALVASLLDDILQQRAVPVRSTAE